MTLSVYFVTPDGVSDATVLAAVRGGARLVQLRDKTASDAAMTDQARRLVRLLAPFGVPLIVNDRLRVALAAGAAGLHVGQTDGDPVRLRAALGPRALLGLSIEDAAQLRGLAPGTVDYIGAGPVRATPSKPDHADPIGLAGLGRIVALSPVPVVAIGGIGRADAAAIRATGAAGMAVVSAIAGAVDPRAAARDLALAWGGAA
ncbi:MAG: thiamine phosphate synthase [Rhodobacteraceae bacterium]|nr:thiamine phosphate synthase [Paracoccaceae bacterium]